MSVPVAAPPILALPVEGERSLMTLSSCASTVVAGFVVPSAHVPPPAYAMLAASTPPIVADTAPGKTEPPVAKTSTLLTTLQMGNAPTSFEGSTRLLKNMPAVTAARP